MTNDPAQIRIADYDYELPENKIAQFPLDERDASKLLIYNNEDIREDVFAHISRHLPSDSLLVFNKTKVIQARLIIRKPTGALIEIFCLEPLLPFNDLQLAFSQGSGVTWKCLVGNLKRWRSGTLLLNFGFDGMIYQFLATRTQSFEDGSAGIRFDWDPPEVSFSRILEIIGLVPLPPYINRPPEKIDEDRYQTIFATDHGSVAAPTAGLHFTERVLDDIRNNGIREDQVTLHVGVGTFRPVTSDLIGDHRMHHERIIVNRDTIQHLLQQAGKPVIAVGTTAARTLESLYWLGSRVIYGNTEEPLTVSQWEPYEDLKSRDIPVADALEALLTYLDNRGLRSFSGDTQLMIVPGYQFRIVSGIITNFHMPQSTLLLLVAALIGPEWKEVYQYALDHQFRFLSYGDACLFYNRNL